MVEDIMNTNVLSETDPDEESRKEAEEVVEEEKWRPRFLDSEAEAEREGSLQFSAGVVRVTDAPTPEPLVGNKGLYSEDTLGITEYDSLRQAVGLKENQSFTDYYAQNKFIPEGYEMAGRMLLHEEKVKRHEKEYLDGDVSYQDFLFEAYGRDLLKSEGHDLTSTLYWYNRRRQGLYDNPLDNDLYVSSLIDQAEKLYTAETWHRDSRDLRLDETFASYGSGVELPPTQLREIFGEAFEVFDQWYESDEEIVRMYKAGMLSGFDPTIMDEEGNITGYLHSDGKFYNVVGANESASSTDAIAHYNSDNTLDRIVVPGMLGEYSGSFVKGLASIFGTTLDIGMYAGVGLWNTIENVFTGDWTYDTLGDAYIGLEGWKNQQWIFRDDIYATSSGFKKSDGSVNVEGIGRGIASAAGTIIGMIGTAGIGKKLQVVGQAGQAGMSGAVAGSASALATKKGGAKAVTGALGSGIKKGATRGINTIGSVMTSTTGLANGMPVVKKFGASSTAATVQGLMFLGVRDWGSSVASLTARKDEMGLTNAEIIGKSTAMTAMNFGVSYAFRSVLDKASLLRHAERRAGMLEKAYEAGTSTRRAMDDKFVNFVTGWASKSPKGFMLTNAGLDIFENMFTIMTHSSMMQTGDVFSKEGLQALWNPQTLATQAFIYTTTYKGGFGKLNEGLQTGGILTSLGRLQKVDMQFRQKMNSNVQALRKSGKNTEAQSILRFMEKYDKTQNDTNNKVMGMTKSLRMAHEMAARETGDSVVRDIIMTQFKNNAAHEIMQDVEFTLNHYNNVMAARGKVDRGLFTAMDSDLGTILSKVEGIGGGAWYKKFDNVGKQFYGSIQRLTAQSNLNYSESVKVLNESVSKTIQDVSSTKLFDDIKIDSGENTIAVRTNPDTGKLEFDINNRLDELGEEAFKNLQEITAKRGLQEGSVAHGKIIKIDGAGTKAQGSEEYARKVQIFDDAARLSEFDEYGTALMYKLADDTYFIPFFDEFTHSMSTATTGASIRLLYALRFNSSAEQRQASFDALINLKYGEDAQADPDYGNNVLEMMNLLLHGKSGDGFLVPRSQMVDIALSKNVQAAKNSGDLKLYPGLRTFFDYADAYELAVRVGDAVTKGRVAQEKKVVKEFLDAFRKLPQRAQAQLAEDAGITKFVLEKIKAGDLDTNPMFSQQAIEKIMSDLLTSGQREKLSQKQNQSLDKVLKLLSETFGETYKSEVLHYEKAREFAARQATNKNVQKNIQNIYSEMLDRGIDPFELTPQSLRDFVDRIGHTLKPSGGSKSTPDQYKDRVLTRVMDDIVKAKRRATYKIFGTSPRYVAAGTQSENAVRALGALYDTYKEMNPNTKITRNDVITGNRDVIGRYHPEAGELNARQFIERAVFRDSNAGYLKALEEMTVTDRLVEAYALATDIWDGDIKDPGGFSHLIDVEGSNEVTIDLSEIRGFWQNKLNKVVSNMGDIRAQEVQNARTYKDKLTIIFGEDAAEANASMAREEAALSDIRRRFGDRGVITLPYDGGRLESHPELNFILKRLGYGHFDLLDLEHKYPGVHYKPHTDKGLKLSFEGDIEESASKQAAFREMLNRRVGITFEDMVKASETADVDYSVGMEEFFGMFNYIDGATKIYPSRITLSDIDITSMSFKDAMDSISAIAGLDIKQGKNAGALLKLYTELYRGAGIQGVKDLTLSRPKTIIDVIKTLEEYRTELADIDKAYLWINLTDDEVAQYQRLGMWNVERMTPEGEPEQKTRYKISQTEDFYARALEYVEQAAKNNTDVDMRQILPLPKDGANADNLVLSNDSRLIDANQLKPTPGSFVSSYMKTALEPDEFFTFVAGKHSVDYRGYATEADVLKAIQGKTVDEILSTQFGKTKIDGVALNDNIYFKMLKNTLEAGKVLNDNILATKEFSAESKDFMKIMGNNEVRRIIGHAFNEAKGEMTDDRAADIAQRVNQYLTTKKGAIRVEDNQDTRTFVTSREEARVDSNMIGRLQLENNYVSRVNADDIKNIYSNFDNTFIRGMFPDETRVQNNIYSKIQSIFNLGGATRSKVLGDVEMFISSLYDLSRSEFDQMIKILTDAGIDSTSIKALKEKFSLIAEQGTLYGVREGTPVRNIEDMLMYQKGDEPSARLSDHYIHRKGDANEGAMRRALLHAKNMGGMSMYKKEFIKLAAMDQYKGAHETALQGLKGLVADSLRNNNKGSTLIQNIAHKEVLGQLARNLVQVAEYFEMHKFEFANKGLSSDAAVDLALKMYLASTGMDHSREWSKYMLFDLQQERVVEIAEEVGSGHERLNSMIRNMSGYLDESNAGRYVLFELDKNMFTKTNSLAGRGLKYTWLNAQNMQDFRDIIGRNAVEQFKYHKFTDDMSFADKVSKVYARTYTQNDIQNTILGKVQADPDLQGILPATIRSMFLNQDALSYTNMTRNLRETQFFNDIHLNTKYTNDEKQLVNLMERNLNEVMKYFITYNDMPDDMKKNLSGLAMKYNDSKEVKALNTKYDLERGFNILKNKGWNHKDFDEYVLTKSPSSAREKMEFFHNLIEYSIVNSREARDLNFLLNDGDINKVINRRSSDNEVEIEVRVPGQTEPLKLSTAELLQDGFNVADAEAFYNDKGTFVFQVSFKTFEGVKDYESIISRQKSLDVKQDKSVYVPVFIKGDTGEDILLTRNYLNNTYGSVDKGIETLFKAFYDDYYSKHQGTKDAIKKWLDHIAVNAKKYNTEGPKVLDDFVGKALKENDLVTLGFNSKEYDLGTVDESGNISKQGRLLEAGLIKQDSFLFKKHVDVRTDIVRGLSSKYSSTDTHKNSQEELMKTLGLDEIYSKAHDADEDTKMTAEIAIHFLGRLADINRYNSDILDKIDVVGRKILGDRYEENLRGMIAPPKLNEQGLGDESKQFLNSYKNMFDGTKTSKINKLVKGLLEDYNHMLVRHESEVQMRKMKHEYQRLAADHKDFYDFLQKKGSSDFRALFEYVIDKSHLKNDGLTVERLIDKGGILNQFRNMIKTVFNVGDDFNNLSMKQMESLFMDGADKFLDKLLTSSKGALMPDASVEDFQKSRAKYTGETLGKLIDDINNSPAAKEIKDFDQKTNLMYHVGFGMKDFFNDLIADVDDPWVRNRLVNEATTFLGKNTQLTDDAFTKRTENIRKYILSGQAKLAQEFLKGGPLQNFNYESIYKLVQGMQAARKYTVKGEGQKNPDPDTIYLSQSKFEELFPGMSYEEAQKVYGQDIYTAMLRHPGDRVGSVNLYKVKIIEDAGIEVGMDPDVLKSLHQGDLDGDHITIIKPSRAIQDFAKAIVPETRKPYYALSKLMQETSRTKGIGFGEAEKLTELAIPLFEKIAEDDLDRVKGDASYYDRQLKEVVGELEKLARSHGYNTLADDVKELTAIAEIVWLREYDLSMHDTKGKVYITHNHNVISKPANVEAFKRLSAARNLRWKQQASLDSITGSEHKNMLRISETVTDDKVKNMFNYAALAPTEATMLALKSLGSTEAKNMLSNIFKADKGLSDENKGVLDRLVNNISADADGKVEAEDVIAVLQAYERMNWESERFHDIAVKAIDGLDKYTEEAFEDTINAHDKALQLFAQSQGVEIPEKVGSKYWDAQIHRSELIDSLLETGGNHWIAHGKDYAVTEEMINQRTNEIETGSREFYNTLGEDSRGFTNYTKAEVLYVVGPKNLTKGFRTPEDTVYVTEKGQSELFITRLKKHDLDVEDYFLVNNPKGMKADSKGIQLTKDIFLSEGVKVNDVIEHADGTKSVILENTKGVTGSSKLALTGSRMGKSTTLGKAPANITNILKKAKLNPDLIYGPQEFNRKHMSPILADAMAENFRYFDATGKEVKDINEAAFIHGRVPVSVVEEGDFWGKGLKSSDLDEITLANNASSLEGAALLGNMFVKATDGNVSYSNKFNSEMRDFWRQYNAPTYMEHNAMYLHHALMLKTLIKHIDDSQLAPGTKSEILHTALNSSDLAGKGGLEVIRSLINRHFKNRDDFHTKLSTMEKVIFSEDLYDKITDPKGSISMDDPVDQTSKSSYHKRIMNPNLPKSIISTEGKIADLAREMPYSQRGSNQVYKDGDMYAHDNSLGYMSMIDYQNYLINAMNRLDGGGGNRSSLSRFLVDQGTLKGTLNTSNMIQGNFPNDYRPIVRRDASIMERAPRLLTRVNEKTGHEVTPDTISKYLGFRPTDGMAEETRFRPEDHENFGTQHFADKYNEFFKLQTDEATGSNKYNLDARELNSGDLKLSPNESKVMAFLLGSLGTAKSNLGRAQLFGRGENDITLSTPLNGLDIDNDGNYRFHTDNRTLETTADNWQSDVIQRYSNSQFYDKVDVFNKDSQANMRNLMDGFDRQHFEKNRPDQIEKVLNTGKDDDSFFQPRQGLKNHRDTYERFYFSEQGLSKLDEAARQSTKTFVEARGDIMQETFKRDLLETSGLKIDSGLKANLDRIVKDYGVEPRMVEAMLGRPVVEVYNDAKNFNAINELNEYAWKLGLLSRIKQIDKDLGHKKLNNSRKEKLVGHKKLILKELGTTTKEAEADTRSFERQYEAIARKFQQANEAIKEMAKTYAKLTDEVHEEIYWLLTPNRKSDTSDPTEARKELDFYRRSLFGYNMNSVAKKVTDYSSYNYFDSINQTIRQMSHTAAAYNMSQRMQASGVMVNAEVAQKAQETFSQMRGAITDLRSPKHRLETDIANIKIFHDAMNEAIGSYRNAPVFDKSLQQMRAGSWGESWMSLYDDLQNYIHKGDNKGLSYNEAKRQYRTTEDISVKADMNKIMKAYDLSNDIMAIISHRAGRNFTHLIYGNIEQDAKQKGYALVDTYGRIYRSDVADYKMLNRFSTSAAKEIIQFYSKNNGGFETNVALQAMNGDAYYMPRDLAMHLDKYFFTHKVPSKIKSFLLKTQRLATKLIMANPTKIIDRKALFTAFDYTTLGLANKGIVGKTPLARNLLSQYMQSKGAVLDPQLKEFFDVVGIDPLAPSYNVLFNNAEHFRDSGQVLKGYFDYMGSQLSHQHLLGRFAYYLSTKEKLETGRLKNFGAAYQHKDKLDSIEARKDLDGNVLISKEGQQAAFLMSQQIGAMNDFPLLSKHLQGYAMFTTFPLALIRWGRGEGKSMHSAMKNLFVDGEQGDAVRHLAVQGLGILGIYLVTNLLTSMLADQLNLDEDTEEEWKDRQAFPEFFKTLVQGTPVMNTFSSHNPVRGLEDLTARPFREAAQDEDASIMDAFKDWFLSNAASRGNPFIRSTAEVMGGVDLYGGTIVDNSDRWSLWENFLRKSSAYLIGGSGANAMTNYISKDLPHEDKNALGKIMEGARRVTQAELGNTRAYKADVRNYWQANELIQNYRFMDYEPDNQSFSSDFDFDSYTDLRRAIGREMNRRAKPGVIYDLITDSLEDGMSISEVRSAVNNNSLEHKLLRIDNLDEFIAGLEAGELDTIKRALAFEKHTFPWLDEIRDEMTEASQKERGYTPYKPQVRTPNVWPERRYSNSYTPSPPRMGYRNWKPPVTSMSPTEAYSGRDDRYYE